MNPITLEHVKGQHVAAVSEEAEAAIERNYDKDEIFMGIIVNNTISVATKHFKQGVIEKKSEFGLTDSDIDALFDEVTSIVIEKYLTA